MEKTARNKIKKESIKEKESTYISDWQLQGVFRVGRWLHLGV